MPFDNPVSAGIVQNPIFNRSSTSGGVGTGSLLSQTGNTGSGQDQVLRSLQLMQMLKQIRESNSGAGGGSGLFSKGSQGQNPSTLGGI